MKKIYDSIKIIKEEIIDVKVDAILNPVDESFCSNDLNKLILKKAGDKLSKKLSKVKDFNEGDCIITKGYNLNSSNIIHTFIPKWTDDYEKECEKLYNCYKNSIELAVENENKTIAIPQISFGEDKFPLDKSSNIAYYVAWKMINKYKYLETIYFCCINKNSYEAYKKLQQDYKDIEVSLETIEQYRKNDKYNSHNYTPKDFIKKLDIKDVYNIFLLKEAFLSGDIEIGFIEDSVKVLQEIFLQIKNANRHFNQKIHSQELDMIQDILNEIFITIDFDTIESAKLITKEYFINANDYIFEKINNSYRY